MSLLEEKTTKIISSGDWQAWILPELGMNVIAISYKGEQILFTPESIEQIPAGRYCQYGVPLTLPPNRTAEGSFVFEGTKYQMEVNEPARNNNLHGGMAIQTKAFAVLSHSENEITAQFDNDCLAFPFPYKATVSVKATENGIFESITICNTGDKNMPLTFGVHTVFVEKAFSVPIDKLRETNENLIPTGNLLPLTEEHESYTNGTYKGGTCIDTFFTSKGKTALIGDTKFTVSDNFDSWIIWNGNSKSKFIAVEPQQGAPNALNSGDGLIVLSPGQSETYTLSFTK